MRLTSEAWSYAIAASHATAGQIDAYRDGVTLLADVPVLSAAVSYDDTALLRRQLTLTVPESMPDGTSLDPEDNPDHPFAAYGQRLHVRAGIVHGNGFRELLDHGHYLITGWERRAADHTVDVSAVDLTQLLADARHYHTETPGAGNTYAQELVRLVDGILPVWVHPDLPATKVNPATVWDRDRTKNIGDLATAWGARVFVDDSARLAAWPQYAPVTDASTPVKSLSGGFGGTVVDRDRQGARERLYNAAVVAGKSPDDLTLSAPWAVAEVTDPASPIRVGGPYGRKPRFYQSDMLTTTPQCQATADELLRTITAVSRSETVQAIPDGALELGDVVEVVTHGYRWIGRVQAVTLPLLATGPMDVTISNTPPTTDNGG